MKFQTQGGTVLDMLLSLESATTRGARFITPSFAEKFYPYSEILQRIKTSAATLQQNGVKTGDRVAVILPTSIQFFDAFLGAQLAGGVPTALYPPFRLGKLDEYFARLREMLNRVGARFLITDSRIKKLLGGATTVESLVKVFDAKELFETASAKPSDWKEIDIHEEDPVFLQFSSGTTLKPKAVQVSHVNLIENLKMMGNTLDAVYRDGTEADRGCVSWLPLYHDMGLVGCLYLGLSYPATITYMGPEMFVGFPAMWLQAMSKYKAVISTAPNFAYGLCLHKIKDKDMEGVDLSNWLLALNGAEPIDTDTMNRFAERFARWGFRKDALTPVYGLAEAGLGVTFSKIGEEPIVVEFDRDLLSTEGRAARGPGRKLPSVGKPLPGLRIEIRDPEGVAVPETWIGRIFVSGPSITKGYFNDPEMTADILGADGWLNTGDLGFEFEGNLYIAGRAKDLIILRGRNYAPQEFEDPLYELDGIRLGCSVAVSTTVEGQGEQLIILAEKDSRSERKDDEVAADIRARLLATVSMEPWLVEMLEPGTLPRTSSGKLRRSEALRQFLAGELTPPEKVTTLRILKEVAKSQIAWARFSLNNKK
jgi:acyl-CoA synthetase (AMP-forming)/AMP-acid ligase II